MGLGGTVMSSPLQRTRSLRLASHPALPTRVRRDRVKLSPSLTQPRTLTIGTLNRLVQIPLFNVLKEMTVHVLTRPFAITILFPSCFSARGLRRLTTRVSVSRER